MARKRRVTRKHGLRLPVRYASLFIACLTAACTEPPTSLGTDQPVVSLVLIAGQSRHEAVITLAAPASGPIPSTPLPVPPSEVSLGVRDEAGTLHPLGPTGEPGRFRVELDALPGHQYQLEGTIGGEPVTAETTVPSRFEMMEPAGDTLRASAPGTGPAFWEAPYRFETEGGAGFSLQLVQASGLISVIGSLRERSGVWRLFLLPTLDYTAPLHLRILALDQAAAQWLFSSTPRSNIRGALGGFGSALPLVRPLVVE